MIELSEMIRELRREFTTALSEGNREQVRFELGPVEVEASVTVSKEASGNARLRFLVVEGGGTAKVAQAETQRITFTLQPRIADSGAAVLISGDDVAGER
ncbi:trypco2 family protein [Streptomyces sp. cg36]|uniref:trypco2 family protein n=1 Tax=Streptomyces sp. cg36 TaxID=3238798 RepID=UPI0034E2A522